MGTVTASNKYLSCPDDFLATYSLAVYPYGGGDYIFLLNKDVNYIREAYPSSTDTGTPKYYALFGPTISGSTITNELSFIVGPTPDAAYSVELHYYYYPLSIVQGVVTGLATGATVSAPVDNGTYVVALNSFTGSGTGLTVSIVIVDQAPTSITVVSGGSGYAVGDLVASSDSSPVTITAFIGTVNNPTGTSWLGDNFDTVLLYGALVEAYTFMKGEQDLIALYDGKYKEALALAKRLGDGMERQDAYRSGQYRQAVT
jgi:hypothetical protein